MERIKRSFLIGLWVVWVAILGLRWFIHQESVHVPLKYTSGQKASRTAPGVPAVVTRISLRETDLSPPTPKNIFAPLVVPGITPPPRAKSKMLAPSSVPPAGVPVTYTPPPTPPLSPEELAAQQERLRREQAAQQAQRQREAAIQQTRQQMSQYRFLGYLNKNGESQAFLGKGQDLYIVRVGETVEGEIHVATHDDSSLTLRDPTTQVEHTLQLKKDGPGP